MIDWPNLAANALWIFGCALALATVSYARWDAAVRGERLRARLREPQFRAPLYWGGTLFCLGWAATSASWLETALWALLTGVCAFRAVSIGIARRRDVDAT